MQTAKTPLLILVPKSALITLLSKIEVFINAKLSNDELYNLISDGVVNTENIKDELKSRIINKASIYKNDISDYVYDIEVSLLGVSK